MDLCDRWEPQITAALGEASADIMEAWVKAVGLNGEQAQALREHHRECANSRAELVSTSRALEGEFGYLLWAMAEFDTWGEMLEDQIFQRVKRRWSLARVRKGDEGHIRRWVLPTTEKTAGRLAAAWERETDELTRPYLESKPELHCNVRQLAQVLAKEHVLEYLRHEFLGRNSFHRTRATSPQFLRNQHSGNRTSAAFPGGFWRRAWVPYQGGNLADNRPVLGQAATAGVVLKTKDILVGT